MIDAATEARLSRLEAEIAALPVISERVDELRSVRRWIAAQSVAVIMAIMGGAFVMYGRLATLESRVEILVMEQAGRQPAPAHP